MPAEGSGSGVTNETGPNTRCVDLKNPDIPSNPDTPNNPDTPSSASSLAIALIFVLIVLIIGSIVGASMIVKRKVIAKSVRDEKKLTFNTL